MRSDVNFSAQRTGAYGRTNTIRIIGGNAAIRVSIVMWYPRTRRLKFCVSLPAHNRYAKKFSWILGKTHQQCSITASKHRKIKHGFFRRVLDDGVKRSRKRWSRSVAL